jgi:hypothetical protein
MTTTTDIDLRKETLMPFWIRVYNVILGLILFSGTIYVLLYPDITQVTIILFAILLLLIGLSRLINGVFDKGKRTLIRITKVIVGFILIALAFLTYFADNLFGETYVIMFLSIALLINGITRLVVVFARKGLPDMIKVLMIVLGFMMIILAGFVLGVFIIGEPFFVVESILVGILAISVQLSGIGRLTSGISGYRLTTRKTEAEYQLDKEKKKEEKKQEKLEEELRKAKKKARN